MRREALVKVGLYDEELPYSYGLDYDWVLRAAKVGSIGLVAQPLADIRKDGTSWYQGGAHKTAEGLEYLLAKHPDIATSRRGHARILGQIAYARSSLGERGPALRYALRSLSRWPLSPHPYIALVQITTRIHPRYVLRAAQLLRRGQGCTERRGWERACAGDGGEAVRGWRVGGGNGVGGGAVVGRTRELGSAAVSVGAAAGSVGWRAEAISGCVISVARAFQALARSPGTAGALARGRWCANAIS